MRLSIESYQGGGREWDEFVASQPDGTHAHRYAWRDVVASVYGHQCPFLAARAPGGALAGVLPLVHVRTRLLGGYLVSMPYLNRGGPLGTPEARTALVARAAEVARALGARLLEIRAAAPDATLDPADEKITCLLDLEGGAEAVWGRLPAKVRSQVRRPQKEGAQTSFGADQIPAFFEVFARGMRDLGTPTHPERFFRALARGLGEDAWFGCVYLGGTPAAAGCAIRHQDTLELVWAASLRTASSPNMLLYWAFLARAAEHGVASFDFGRCTPGGGTHRFKRQWGARDVPLPWARRGRPESLPRADRPLFSLATRLWRHLPLPVAGFLGPRLRGAIPA